MYYFFLQYWSQLTTEEQDITMLLSLVICFVSLCLLAYSLRCKKENQIENQEEYQEED